MPDVDPSSGRRAEEAGGALLEGEAAAPMVRELLAQESDAAVTPLGVAEVLDHLVRMEGAIDEDAALDLAQLGLGEHAHELTTGRRQWAELLGPGTIAPMWRRGGRMMCVLLVALGAACGRDSNGNPGELNPGRANQ